MTTPKCSSLNTRALRDELRSDWRAFNDRIEGPHQDNLWLTANQRELAYGVMRALRDLADTFPPIDIDDDE